MKTPAFQFYPGDFLSSPDVQIMTAQEVGAYWLLLTNSWIISDKPGYLPNNERKLQRLSRLSVEQWEEAKEILLEKFVVSECGGFIYNKRLVDEAAKQELRRQRLAENGQKGGRPPKTPENQEPETPVEAEQPEPNNQEETSSLPIENQEVSETKANDNQNERLSSSSSTTYNILITPNGDVDFKKAKEYFLKTFNELTGKSHRTLPKKAIRQLKERLLEGYRSFDFKAAIITCKNDKFHRENNLKYLTPEFITRADKLEMYLSKVEAEVIRTSTGTAENPKSVSNLKEYFEEYGELTEEAKREMGIL